jgi:hypothetical protein
MQGKGTTATCRPHYGIELAAVLEEARDSQTITDNKYQIDKNNIFIHIQTIISILVTSLPKR